MEYDWVQIFENKTDKELYDIYTGKSLLPLETKIYAERELKRRNFNFDNLEKHKMVWELISLKNSLDYFEMRIRDKLNYVNPKILLVITFFILIVCFTINLTAKNFPKEILVSTLIVVPIMSATVLLNNLTIRKYEHKQNEIIEKIRKIKKNLENDNLLKPQNPIQQEIDRNQIKSKESNKVYITFIIVLSILSLLVLFFVK